MKPPFGAVLGSGSVERAPQSCAGVAVPRLRRRRLLEKAGEGAPPRQALCKRISSPGCGVVNQWWPTNSLDVGVSGACHKIVQSIRCIRMFHPGLLSRSSLRVHPRMCETGHPLARRSHRIPPVKTPLSIGAGAETRSQGHREGDAEPLLHPGLHRLNLLAGYIARKQRAQS